MGLYLGWSGLGWVRTRVMHTYSYSLSLNIFVHVCMYIIHAYVHTYND